MALTDDEYKGLMALDKFIESKKNILPQKGEKTQFSAHSSDGKEKFVININRKNHYESKATLQTRYVTGQNTILVRLDINGSTHTNPDKTVTSRNHIHIYKEGSDDNWAYNVDSFDVKLFKNLNDFLVLFTDYCDYNKLKQVGDSYPTQGVF